MRNLLTFLLVFCLPAQCFCAQKTLIVPEKRYLTIQKAINEANPGDKIKVQPGVYNEKLTFKDGIELEGVDQNSVIIRCDANSGAVIEVNGCNSGFISHLTIEQSGQEIFTDPNKIIMPVVLINSSSVKVFECIIQNGRGNGISIWRKGICEVSDCVIQNNKFMGICIRQGNESSLIKNNKCLNNGGNGIYFLEGVSGNAEKNICSNNNYNGISVMSAMTSVKLIDNLCSDNNGSGIWVGQEARCEAKSNFCAKNKWHGISLNNKYWALLTDNKCTDNKRCGIYYSSKINESDDGNIEKNNGEFNDYMVRAYLWDGNFTDLEETAEKIRSEKRKFANGNWQLDYFYQSLGSWSGRQTYVENKVFKNINDWIKIEPNSITPRITLACAYNCYAWQGRGSGYANTVNDANWQIFFEYLHKGWKALQEAESLTNKDEPEFYNIYFKMGRDLGKTDEEMSDIFDKGILIERDYFPIYNRRAFYLLPRWGGTDEDAEKFAREYDEKLKDTNEFLYAKLAACLISCHSYQDFGKFMKLNFSYPIIKKEHIEILKMYPENYFYLNTFCLLASLYNDKPVSNELFNKIGENWDESVWGKEEVFKKYKDWAFSQKNEPPPIFSEKPKSQPKTSSFWKWLEKIYYYF